jgi:hypothetical protein
LADAFGIGRRSWEEFAPIGFYGFGEVQEESWGIRGIGSKRRRGPIKLTAHEGLPVVKKSAGEDKSVYLGLSPDVHRALRHLAADQDVSVTRLLKNLVNEFVASTSWAQQSTPGDLPNLALIEVSGEDENNT